MASSVYMFGVGEFCFGLLNGSYDLFMRSKITLICLRNTQPDIDEIPRRDKSNFKLMRRVAIGDFILWRIRQPCFTTPKWYLIQLLQKRMTAPDIKS